MNNERVDKLGAYHAEHSVNAQQEWLTRLMAWWPDLFQFRHVDALLSPAALPVLNSTHSPHHSFSLDSVTVHINHLVSCAAVKNRHRQALEALFMRPC